ncbi:MAG: ABC transporter substrate-binding protein [Pseudonocardiaceae bacterium]
MAQGVTLAGDVLGGTAPERAKAYVDYLNNNVNLVQSRLANLPESQRPSVVHIPSFPPLTVDGGGSTQGGLWINTAGGRSEFSDQEGTYITVSAEELLERNPDVLVIQAPREDASGQSVVAALAEQLPVWNELKAVQNNRVYLNPRGMYPWERSTPEQALQVLWAAKTLHPDLFADIDMRAEARNFYNEFFNYSPTDADLDEIFQVNP